MTDNITILHTPGDTEQNLGMAFEPGWFNEMRVTTTAAQRRAVQTRARRMVKNVSALYGE